MRAFRYLPPSPQETRAFFVFAFGAFLGQLVAFCLAMVAPSAASAAVAIGGGLAILARFGAATWQYDVRRRRAQKAQIELESDGIRLTDAAGNITFVRFDEVTEAQSKNGRLEISFRQQKWSFGAREVENGLALTQEILRRVQKPEVKRSNFIPLDPL